MAEIQKGNIPPRPAGPEPLGQDQVRRPVGPIKQAGDEKGAGKPVLSADRYTPKVLNEVMRGLKSLIARLNQWGPEKGFPGSLLTPFESSFIARFEGGAELGERLEEGKAKFLEKTEKGWVEFFQKFVAFTLTKTARLADLEALIYRGLMKGGGKEGGGEMEAAGTVVSDLRFVDGKTDKFARLEVQGPKILEGLVSHMPGDLLARALVAEWVGGPEFAYQALSHKVVNPDWKSAAKDSQEAERGGFLAQAYQSPEKMKESQIREGTREVTPGIALSARTEQLMAERLDLNPRPVRNDSESIREPPRQGLPSGGGQGPFLGRKKKRGLLGPMWEDAPETGPAFVPWYQQVLQPQRAGGKVKWYVPLIYFVSISAVVLSLFYVFKFLLTQ